MTDQIARAALSDIVVHSSHLAVLKQVAQDLFLRPIVSGKVAVRIVVDLRHRAPPLAVSIGPNGPGYVQFRTKRRQIQNELLVWFKSFDEPRAVPDLYGQPVYVLACPFYGLLIGVADNVGSDIPDVPFFVNPINTIPGHLPLHRVPSAALRNRADGLRGQQESAKGH